MDTTDIKIINILQENCKTTTREIGAEVGLTAPAVSERITRLKELGVIEGFAAKINPSLLGKGLSAFIAINVPPEEYEAFCLYAKKSPMIVEHYHIIGPNNALLKILVANASELEQQLSALRAFGLSQTSVVLTTYFDHKP
ncbi:MAG: Lrp/AsnC family transcriptional regulator, partial [Pygmaiobacter sp.]